MFSDILLLIRGQIRVRVIRDRTGEMIDKDGTNVRGSTDGSGRWTYGTIFGTKTEEVN